MKTLFTSEAISKGGRSGTVRSPDRLHAVLPGIDPDQAQRIMEGPHRTCPYSKALRGDVSIVFVVDRSLSALPPTQEKNHGRDSKLHENLPAETQELSELMDASEKTTGKERVAVTKSIRDKAEQGVSLALPPESSRGDSARSGFTP